MLATNCNPGAYAPLGPPGPYPTLNPKSEFAQGFRALKFGRRGRAPKARLLAYEGAGTGPGRRARPEARPLRKLEGKASSVFVRIFLEGPQGASCSLSPCGAPDKLSANAIRTDGVYRGNPSTTPNRKQA